MYQNFKCVYALVQQFDFFEFIIRKQLDTCTKMYFHCTMYTSKKIRIILDFYQQGTLYSFYFIFSKITSFPFWYEKRWTVPMLRGKRVGIEDSGFPTAWTPKSPCSTWVPVRPLCRNGCQRVWMTPGLEWVSGLGIVFHLSDAITMGV